MYEIINEINISCLIVAIFIANQITAYLLYQVYKNRKEPREIKVFNLSFAFLYGLGLNGWLLRIYLLTYSDYYINNHLSFFEGLIALSIIIFFFLISSGKFSSFLRKTYYRMFSVFIFLLYFICVVIFNYNGHIYYLILFFCCFITYTNLIYKIMKNVSEKIKSRLKIIFLGQSIIIVGFIIDYQQFTNHLPIQVGLDILSVVMILVGLIIMLQNILGAPIFVDLDWKKKIDHFYIIYQNENNIWYHFDFSQFYSKSDSNSEDTLIVKNIISGGISGIDDIISEITETQANQIKRIRQGSKIILLDYYQNEIGLNLAFVLIFESENELQEYFLEKIKTAFLDRFMFILESYTAIKGNEELIFRSFDSKLTSFLV